jgi:hypothetical protein
VCMYVCLYSTRFCVLYGFSWCVLVCVCESGCVWCALDSRLFVIGHGITKEKLCVCARVCVCVCMYKCVCVYMCVYIYIKTYTSVCMYVILPCVCMFRLRLVWRRCMRAFLCLLYDFVCFTIRKCVHVCVCVCMCVCAFVSP